MISKAKECLLWTYVINCHVYPFLESRRRSTWWPSCIWRRQRVNAHCWEVLAMGGFHIWRLYRGGGGKKIPQIWAGNSPWQCGRLSELDEHRTCKFAGQYNSNFAGQLTWLTFNNAADMYRVTHLLANLGWVDFDLGCSKAGGLLL